MNSINIVPRESSEKYQQSVMKSARNSTNKLAVELATTAVKKMKRPSCSLIKKE